MSVVAVVGQAQSQFTVSSATFGTPASASIPAGINGAVLTLSGTLPSAAQQESAGYLACFYTGYGSTTGFALSSPNNDGTEPLTVPASTIQSVPQGQFTAANGYSVQALVYFIASTGVCDGTFDATLTNQFPVKVIAPSLGAYSGPVNIPLTSSLVTYEAPPLALVLPASGFLPVGSPLGVTTVVFGISGGYPIGNSGTSTSSVYVPVPFPFYSSVAGTTTSLSICNTLTGVDTPVCTTPDPAITLTITAPAASAGTLTLTPTPVFASGQTVMKVQFGKGPDAGTAPNLGAPSGLAQFTAGGTILAPAPLVLDTTATFVSQPTTVTVATAPTPTFTPAAGSYTGVQTVTIADSNAAAAIYYTQNGSTPSSNSTRYTAPFTISTSQTIKAVAAIAGSLNSAVASAAYVVTIRPATHLAFQVQPVTTGLNTAVSPAIQVSVLDATNAVVTSSTAAITMAIANNPANGVLAGTTTVNAVNGIATFSNLSIGSLGTGYTLRATSGTLTGATSSAFDITPPPITMAVQSTLIGIASTLNGTFTLGVAAPTGGLTVNLSSGTPANVTIAPATVVVAAGQTAGTFTYTGVAAGNSILKATATGYQDGTVLTTGTAAQVSLGLIPNVAPAQTQSLALSLATAAPAGGTTVTFTIANTNIATVTQTVFVPAGQFTASTNPQVTGVLIGTTTVTANAPGYAPATRTVTVTVVASINPSTTNINLITSTNTVLNISAPAPPGGIKFNLISDDPSKVTVPASVTVIQGGTTVKIPITGVSDGTTTIRATSAGITEADGTVNVNSSIVGRNYITGYGLEYYDYFYLPVSPSTPTLVTITSNDPTVAVISASNTAVGQTTVTFPNTTSSTIGYLYIQGKKVGSTTLTISAPGYTSGTETVTVDRTGFAYYGLPNITTTDYASPSTGTVYPVPLNADGSIYNYFGWAVNPGAAAISVPITSSDTTIGTVTSPLVFNALDTSQNFTFTPVAVGTTNLTIGTPPAGFTVPMSNQQPQYQQITATVNTPAISVSGNTTGVHLQINMGIGLPVAPPAGVTVTVAVTSAAGIPTVASISKSNTVVGTGTLTFTNVTSTSAGTIYVQGLSAGTATITVSAPGYTTGTNTITVQPSGFAYYYGNNTINTTSFSGTNTLTVYPFLLDGNKAISGYPYYTINPGVGPVTVPITNSDNSVGTISATSLTFNTNDNYKQFTFQPVSAGTDNITIGAVAGFTTPTTYQQATATVTAPSISIGSQQTGVHLQSQFSIYLPVAPPNPVTVTVTTSAPLVGTLSKDSTTVGVTTLTFTNVTSSYVGSVYLQGQSAGTATITESAPGYVTGTATLTVKPSGFTFYYNNPTFTTTTFSPASSIGVYTTTLDASGNIQNAGSYPLSPGVGPVTVSLTDSNTSVGTISTNSLTFNTNDTGQTFTFQPVSAGTANIAIGVPAGFSTPTQYQGGTVTVTAPVISVGSPYTGLNLETSLNINLPQTPPNPVTVTVKSNGPLIAVLSNGATVAGSGTLTFTNVTSTYVGTIYVQGVSVGSTTIKVSAPGYTDGDGVLTVLDSGFDFYYGSPTFSTTVGASNYQLTVYPVLLNHQINTIYSYSSQYVSPSAGSVSVPITSSNTAVGTIVTSPVVFAPGDSGSTTYFHPVATGTSTITLGTPTGFTAPSQYTTGTATVQ